MRNLLFSLVLLCMPLLNIAEAREPLQDPDTLVPVELATIAVDPLNRVPVVLLRDPGSGDIVPISIGSNEAMAIMRALGSVEMPRPMTHDTAVAMIEAMGGRLERVLVDALIDNSYRGVLDIRMQDDEDTPVYVDTRPSDGLALAVRTGAGILVAPDVLQQARDRSYEGMDDQVVTALGISVVTVTDEIRDQLDLPEHSNVLVVRVTGAAEEQGVANGALILSVNGETPETALEYLNLVQETEAGENAVIRYWHEGEEHRIELDTDVPATRDRRRSDEQFI